MSNIWANLLTILVGGLLVNNFVMNRFLGCCPFLGVSKQYDTAKGMSMAVIFVMTLASFFMVVARCSTIGFPQSAQNTNPEKMFGSSMCFAVRFLCCRTSCTISHCSCVMSGWCVFFTRHCSLSGRSIRVLFL